MSLKSRVSALEKRVARLVAENPNWLDPEFRAGVREMDLKMRREAKTIAQVRWATEALLDLVAQEERLPEEPAPGARG